uniref:Protein phosphatase 1 regulatory subunit 21 n=1 Tax=Oncorhynchus kisutch TaxID=8019 RepID=A0A8C7DXG5_ONCKI
MAADLQAKYTKLALEYSKLRAQNQVLKKGVVDEQASSTSLKDQVKQREQSLRKVEQEMDSLTFRNQQLAKRVELLQEELAASEAKGKKSKNKGDSPSQQGLQQTQSVFDEDLQKKIQENERLHIQFYEADEQHRQQESQLKVQLEELERDHEQHQAIVDGLTSKYMDTIERLQSDKARLEVKSQTLEREAKECRARTEECQQQLRKCQSELNRQVKKSSIVIQEKVPFNDTKFSDYNSLNVPPHNRRHQLKARDVAGQALGFVQDIVAALLNFHSYTEQRVHIYPLDSSIEPISPLNQKFSQYLHENAAYVRPLEEGLVQLHQSITEDTVTVLETLSTITQKLRTTNECLLASLGSLTSSTGKIATFFSNNLDFFTSSTGYSPRGGAGALNPLQAESMLGNKKKASDYMHAIRKPRPETVPYREALLHRRVLTSSTESREGLTQQVVASQEKIARLEQEKEHWLLEAQLGRVRLEKESQRIHDLETQLSSALGGGGSPAHSLGQAPGSPALTSLEDGEVEERGAGKEVCLFSISCVVTSHPQCRALAKRLAIAEKSRETLTEEIKLANQNITRLQDELATTKRSYKEQLSMMSDHLCSMNETLSKQREEIDTLKLGSKGNSKLLKKSR